MTLRRALVLICISWMPSLVHAQNPSLADGDLAYSKARVESSRFVARVKLQVGAHEFVRYTCDHSPQGAGITTADGTHYARRSDKPWLQSRDGGLTGTAVDGGMAAKLDDDVKRALLPWVPVTTHDKTQGNSVWRLAGHTKTDGNECFTYERSRENPRAGGVYPRFTFVKYKGATDGRLLLQSFTAQLHDHGVLTPIEVSYDFGVR